MKGFIPSPRRYQMFEHDYKFGGLNRVGVPLAHPALVRIRDYVMCQHTEYDGNLGMYILSLLFLMGL
jgi:hypothetical protein